MPHSRVPLFLRAPETECGYFSDYHLAVGGSGVQPATRITAVDQSDHRRLHIGRQSRALVEMLSFDGLPMNGKSGKWRLMADAIAGATAWRTCQKRQGVPGSPS